MIEELLEAIKSKDFEYSKALIIKGIDTGDLDMTIFFSDINVNDSKLYLIISSFIDEIIKYFSKDQSSYLILYILNAFPNINGSALEHLTSMCVLYDNIELMNKLCGLYSLNNLQKNEFYSEKQELLYDIFKTSIKYGSIELIASLINITPELINLILKNNDIICDIIMQGRLNVIKLVYEVKPETIEGKISPLIFALMTRQNSEAITSFIITINPEIVKDYAAKVLTTAIGYSFPDRIEQLFSYDHFLNYRTYEDCIIITEDKYLKLNALEALCLKGEVMYLPSTISNLKKVFKYGANLENISFTMTEKIIRGFDQKYVLPFIKIAIYFNHFIGSNKTEELDIVPTLHEIRALSLQDKDVIINMSANLFKYKMALNLLEAPKLHRKVVNDLKLLSAQYGKHCDDLSAVSSLKFFCILKLIEKQELLSDNTSLSYDVELYLNNAVKTYQTAPKFEDRSLKLDWLDFAIEEPVYMLKSLLGFNDVSET